jgi:hypothetical protein
MMTPPRWNHCNRQEENKLPSPYWDGWKSNEGVVVVVVVEEDTRPSWWYGCEICGATTTSSEVSCDCASLLEDGVGADARELHRQLVDWYDDERQDVLGLLGQTWRDAVDAAVAATPSDQQDGNVLYWSYFHLVHERGLLGPEEMHHLLQLCGEHFVEQDHGRRPAPTSGGVPACVFVTSTEP